MYDDYIIEEIFPLNSNSINNLTSKINYIKDTYLNDNSNPVKWSTNFNPLIHNYLLCCMQLNLMQEAQKLLLQFPQYKDFYDNINRVHNVNEFFINESMNYFGINGYSFL